MNWGLLIKPLAEGDIHKAQAWYERQREGLGDEFLQEIEESLTRVCQAPEAHATIVGRCSAAFPSASSTVWR